MPDIKNTFIHPLGGSGKIVNKFVAKSHPAIDIAPSSAKNANVVASGMGRVVNVTKESTGVKITIAHILNEVVITTVYSHLDGAGSKVKTGQSVKKGQVLSVLSPLKTGAHLHFEFLLSGQPVDPTAFIAMSLGSVQQQLNLISQAQSKTSYSGKTFIPPCPYDPSYIGFTSAFGNRVHPVYGTVRFHAGIDIGVAGHTNVPTWSVCKGKVEQAGFVGGYGFRVVVDHGNISGKSIKTSYNHLSVISVKQGQTVNQKQQLGIIGKTGTGTGEHLHFEYIVNGQVSDPLIIIPDVAKWA